VTQPSNITSDGDVITSSVPPDVAAAGAFTPMEFVASGSEALAPLEHTSGDVRVSMSTKNVVTSGDDMALNFAPTENFVTSGDDMALAPTQPYRAPTPSDRSPLTLNSMFMAITTTLPCDGARLARRLHDTYATTLDVEATEMLTAAMR